MTAAELPPEALRRTVAAELRGAAVQGSRSLRPGLALGLYAIAALLERRTALDGDDVDQLRGAIHRLLDLLVPGRVPAVVGVAVVPLCFGRSEPARAAR